MSDVGGEAVGEAASRAAGAVSPTTQPDPHTEARETLRDTVEYMQRHEQWQRGRELTAALAALAALESERDELLAIATSANDNTEFFTARAEAAEALARHQAVEIDDYARDLAAAEARVTQLEGELLRQQEMWSMQSGIIRALAAEVPDDVRARVLAPLSDAALGVVAGGESEARPNGELGTPRELTASRPDSLQEVADASDRASLSPTESDLFTLCCYCGTITPEHTWTYWQAKDDWEDEADKWRPSREGEMDPMCRCPACEWEHQDTDDGSGFYQGTLAEMEAQREADLPEYGEGWIEALASVPSPPERCNAWRVHPSSSDFKIQCEGAKGHRHAQHYNDGCYWTSGSKYALPEQTSPGQAG